jgi:glycosyltransferase involved in cell wall biosynthesis
MIETLIVGPDPYSFGGTQTVMRVMRDHSIGADRMEIVPTWDGPGQGQNAWLVARAARRLASANKRTIAHFHISNGGAWVREGMLIQVAQARGLRTVVSLHGYEFPEFARRQPRFVRAVLRRVDHVICLSDESRAEIVRLLNSDRVTVLPNPVSIDHAAPSAAQTQPVVLFAGSVGLRKGVDVLCRAWEQILATGVDGHCRIVGPIEDFTPPHLERMSIEAPVHPDAVGGLVRSARVVVLPSRAEGMPMILTEALAAARPFVATPVGGVRSITPDPEMLVPVDDPNALARKISRYLEDRDYADRAGRLGQKYVIETRSPEVIDLRLREIYRGLR